MLRTRLSAVVGSENISINDAAGCVLAENIQAPRPHPPKPNSAVDGYGFTGESIGEGPQHLPLIAGRAAAGKAFEGTVPKGSAIRILTGATLPDGVDTVILEEDVNADDTSIAFNGPLKSGANARKAGEDVQRGAQVLSKGRVLTPADLGLLSAVGVSQVRVGQKLRVAVLSTGDEVVEPGSPATLDQIYDANRPMLLALIERWGFTPVDMGRAPDDRAALADRLDQAAECADVILTSGGASAGDEDHMSALLSATGSLALWRIALKPGRPLALGVWKNRPVFGFPGNPVAVLICALIFARPSLGLLAGAGWSKPQGFMVPAAFVKNKKPGRREYLRARMSRDGTAEIFPSEGSGRISGLSWAEGLIEIEDGPRSIQPGDLVRFLPFASFDG
ncbi:UNVERIFIED_CONTAM: hypothetical protein GTU68_018788 [Idotea baltica]|nr:hypothetical protein [Idotea baltica]